MDPLDDPVAIRRAGRDLLSLALIDARNVTLAWLARFEQAGALGPAEGASPLWLAGHAGWYQERWIARHVQRRRGEAADPQSPRLASIEPRADAWFDGGDRRAEGLDPSTLRAYLHETLETTLDLLAGAGDDDASLHVYRNALLHEDRLGEALAETAAARQMDVGAPPVRAARDALWMPSQRWMLGSPPGGQVPDNERWAHEVAIPEFEIDAQPVSWSRFVAFAEDGGYDQRAFWSEAGWQWQRSEGRRAPRDVEQLRGGALVMRRGQLQRAPAEQPVLHVSRHEAEAWCRWAGRRLPTEPEWELAAHAGRSRGFVWGEVFEWTAGSARPWPGHAATPGTLDRLPEPGTQGVLRGASWQTRRRRAHPQARRFAPMAADGMFCGFRSCAI